jgi:superfamily II DNA or RNA helicase
VPLSPEYYDFIIIDEVHHISASTYRPILNYFKPKILLGLTATPERMDGENILDDFLSYCR